MNIVVFTDGSCISNGYQDAHGGYGIHFPNKELADVSEPFLDKPITNQRAELYAIKVALEKIIDKFDPELITIYSDSNYSIKCLTVWIYAWQKNDWKNVKKQPIKNLDIIIPTFHLIKKHGNVKFIHVKSHTKGTDYESLCNSVADKLAYEASDKCKVVVLPEKDNIIFVNTKGKHQLANLGDKILIKTKPGTSKKKSIRLKVVTS